MTIPGTSLAEFELNHPKGLVAKWDFVQVDPECRLYYRLDVEPLCGFDFCALEWVCGNAETDPNDLWADAECRVKPLAHGRAAYDGVRHLHVGEGGYVHYPDFVRLDLVLRAIDTLAKEHCWDS